MPILGNASISLIAEIGSYLTEHTIIGIFIMKGLVSDEEHYGEIVSDYASKTSFSKVSKIEGILHYFNNEPKVLGAASALISKTIEQVKPPPDIEQLNGYLIRDGLRYDPTTAQIITLSGQQLIEERISSELEDRLTKLGNHFAAMHKGIWDAISSGSEDSLRHATVSARELLRQVIDVLAGEDQHNLTRKARIERILHSESRTEVVDAVACLVDAIYSSQSASEHTEPDFNTVILVAKMTEYCLLFILREAQGSV